MTHPILSRIVRRIPSDPRYIARIGIELKLLRELDFEECFLQVLDILDLTQDIPHIVRGSASNSLLCYLTGITLFDPIQHDLPLARFMHSLRADRPDIDIDFPWNFHEVVFERVFRKYGNRAARVSNHLHYRMKGAIREAVRRQGINHFLPYNFAIDDVLPGCEKEVLAAAEAIQGTKKGSALHCGGIVILDHAIPEGLLSAPRQLRFDKDEIKDQGLVKIDLLSNRALAQLYDISRKPITDYPECDEKTASLLQTGNVIGIGQAESPVMRKTLVGLQAQCRSDMVLAMALIRPAAASRGRKTMFLENWRRDRKIRHIVFEDDAIRLIQRMTGCSEGEADLIRRAFAKGDTQKMREFAVRIKHLPNQQEILEDLAVMNSYSFCKSHALSYGYLAWALAYQKAHNPHRFWVAALNNLQSMFRPWVHFQEAKAAGLRLTPGTRPWNLVGDTLIHPGHQLNMFDDGWELFRKYGFWTSQRFMPHCYEQRENRRVSFRGLIATARHHGNYTFVMIGTGTRRYLDLVIDGTHDYKDKVMVEGHGVIRNRFDNENIQVTKFRWTPFKSIKRS